MTKYNYLPGTTVELLDGNTTSVSGLTQPIALVIGRAYSGPTDTPVVINDSVAAVNKFGSGSPLIDAATRVKAGGIPTVIVYRVGGKGAELKNFAGTGSSIKTVELSKTAASKLRIYVGPSEANPAVKVLIVFYGTTGNKIVYSNVPGAEVDIGYVTVENFSNTTTTVIGSPTDPVLMSNVTTNGLYQDSTTAHTIAGGVKTWTLSSATPSNFKKINSVTKNGTPITTGYTYAVTGNTINFTATDGVNDDVYVVSYTISAPVVGVTYISGDDALSCSKNEYYELVDKALRESETTVAEYVYVEGAILDEENIADGSTATDKLTYLNLTEEDGEFTYEWSSVKKLYKMGSTTTEDVNLADKTLSGQPVVLKEYNEVNYAHRIGMFCQSVAENDGFILATIETKAPVDFTVKSVSKMVGVLPTYDDASGLIIANGSGLLGNKFMVGTTSRDKGFFATDNGFPDGNTLVDSGGKAIDIGKFLSVVPSMVTYSSKNSSAAAHYLGIIGSTVVGNSTTNRTVPNVTLPFQIKKTKLDELTGKGYVTLVSKSDGIKVVSGELATSDSSDYQYVSTALIVQDIVTKVRKAGDAYVGKGLTQVMINALRTSIDTIIRAATSDQLIESSSYTVNITGIGKISIPMSLTTTNELRQIYIPISLTV